jgi:hypothetical protein
LGCAKAHPDGRLVFQPSDMILRIHSDASYLNRPKSGSTAGGFHYLGTLDPEFINGPVVCHCTRIPVARAAVSEAEHAALFANAQVGCDERVILSCLGHPQPPTPILCDNECAIGLATETVRPKKPKSIDMRFDWLRSRVRQNLFTISWISGDRQLADFFTKALPVHVHVALAPVHCAPPGSTPLSLAPVVPSGSSRSATALSASLTWPFLSDAGATHVLLRRSSFPVFRHLFSPLPDGGSLSVRGSDGGTIAFPGKSDPVDCYACPDEDLAHDLVGASPLLCAGGRAVYTSTDVQFFAANADVPFLTGFKPLSADLWSLDFSAVRSPLEV